MHPTSRFLVAQTFTGSGFRSLRLLSNFFSSLEALFKGMQSCLIGGAHGFDFLPETLEVGWCCRMAIGEGMERRRQGEHDAHRH